MNGSRPELVGDHVILSMGHRINMQLVVQLIYKDSMGNVMTVSKVIIEVHFF